ncbi:MAG: 50S ribosomal protein L4 [Chloroflexi bacterium]|nr:50S ribosomal protein L4 [Chloroflexota bacterium]
MKHAVKDRAGKEIGTIGLNEAVFGVPMSEAIVHQALVWQRNNARQGTAKTKKRHEVQGSTRKPWRQKHTGRARAGQIRSPLWRHGGRIFGPIPKDWSQQLPKKMRRQAIRCLLTNKREEGNLAVLHDLTLNGGKTRELAEVIKALNLHETVLLVTGQADQAVAKSTRNLDSVKSLPAYQINVGDLLKYRHLVMTVDAIRVAEGLWANPNIDRKRTPFEESAMVPAEVRLTETPSQAPAPAAPARKTRTRKAAAPVAAKSVADATPAAAEATPEPEAEKPKTPRRRGAGTGPSTRKRSTRERKEPEA